MTGLAFIGQLAVRGADQMQLWTVLSLIAIAAFIIWLMFFSGNGDFKSFLEDLKGSPKSEKKERFPVPVFDRSKIDLPLPPKPARRPVSYTPTSDEIDLKLDTWAKDLRQSLREVRAESQWLVEKYKDVPLKRPKPEVVVAKKPAATKAKAKPTPKPAASKKTQAVSKKKTSPKPKAAKKAATSKPAKGKK